MAPAKSSRWIGATLLCAGLLAACGARSSLSVPPEGSGGGGGAAASSSSSSGNPCPPSGCAACSDGTREGFVDVATYPGIAGCSGGWSEPGVLLTLAPVCGRVSGNSSSNPSGTGCNVADLCAVGSHVCTSPAEVAARSSTGCDGAAPGPGLFFATRQSSNGCNQCALGTDLDPSVCNGATCQAGCAQTFLTANDLYGCGSLGDAVTMCSTLDQASGDQCGSLGPPWSCPDDIAEANVVTKAGSAGGGVLCCLD